MDALARRFYAAPPRRLGLLRRFLAARDRRILLALLAPRPGERVLDVGCGAGAHARLLAARGLAVTCIDLEPEVVARVAPSVAEALVGDLDELSLGRSFERVVCWGVLEYARDPESALARLAAHVAPGGRLAVQVPERSAAGRIYRLARRAAHRFSPRLLDQSTLDRAAARAGLAPTGHVHRTLHSLALAWEREPQRTASWSNARAGAVESPAP
jgi:2-polyprenyl-3-methyl-5-hydroxy-6-metoxy-1,4-benzoquinol methylase